MQLINGLVWLFFPAAITFFCLWKLAERESKHYRELLIKTNAELIYFKYDMKNKKWDDDYAE